MSREEVKEEMKKDAAERPDDISKAVETLEAVGEGGISREEVKEEMKKDAAELPDNISKAVEALDGGVEGIAHVMDAYVNEEGDVSDVIEAYGKGAGEVAYYGSIIGRKMLKGVLRGTKGTYRHESLSEIIDKSDFSEEDKAELRAEMEEKGGDAELEIKVNKSGRRFDGSIDLFGQVKAEMHADRRGFEALYEEDDGASHGLEVKLGNNGIGGTYTERDSGDDFPITTGFEFGRNKFTYTRTEDCYNGAIDTYKEEIKFKKNGGAVVKTTDKREYNKHVNGKFGPDVGVCTTKYKIKPDGEVTVKAKGRGTEVEVYDNGYFEYAVRERWCERGKFEGDEFCEEYGGVEFSPEDMASLKRKPKVTPKNLRLMAEKLKER